MTDIILHKLPDIPCMSNPALPHFHPSAPVLMRGFPYQANGSGSGGWEAPLLENPSVNRFVSAGKSPGPGFPDDGDQATVDMKGVKAVLEGQLHSKHRLFLFHDSPSCL